VKRHIVLVGLPGSGKTTVGRQVAQQLRTAFTDIDVLVAQAAGRPVAEIFAREGEPAFRRLERAAMAGALAAPPHLIAPGGGWVAVPGNLETAAGAHLIYLRVSPEVAAGRLSDDGSRPLLAGGHPLGQLRELLRQREPWYARAESVVEASGSVEEVAVAVAEVARRGA
jgi:shikimate kinase